MGPSRSPAPAALRRPRLIAVPPADPRGRAGEPRSALVPPRPRRLADRRWQRAVGTRVADARELHRGGAHPPAERAQPPLRAGRTRLAVVAAVAALERLEGAPRRRHPRRRRAGRDGVAVRVHRAWPRPAPRATRRRSCSPGASRADAARRASARLRRCAARAHNVFELSHRFGGWTAIGLFWALTLHLDAGRARRLARVGAGDPDGERRLAVAAAAARPVTVERPSAHAAIVHFDHGVTPGVRVGGRDQPQPAARVARVRDRDDARADRLPPAHLARGRLDRPLHRRPAVARLGARRPVSAPMAKVALLYERVVYVVTGSGIGPASGRSSPPACRRGSCGPRATRAPPTATRSSTRSRRRSPMRVIWDTTERGKPDLVQLAHAGVPRVRRRGCVHRQQQADDAAARPRHGAARHPGLRADLGLLERQLISQRTRDALPVRKAQGVVLGRPREIPSDVEARCSRLAVVFLVHFKASAPEHRVLLLRFSVLIGPH